MRQAPYRGGYNVRKAKDMKKALLINTATQLEFCIKFVLHILFDCNKYISKYSKSQEHFDVFQKLF